MTEFEKYRIMRHRQIAGNFDRVIKQLDADGNSASNEE
jgi:hypothetical protein